MKWTVNGWMYGYFPYNTIGEPTAVPEVIKGVHGQMTGTNRQQITGRVDDSLRTRIAAAQRAHRLTTFGANYVQCECGWKSPEKYSTWTDHPEHVADAVIRELNLERQDHYDPHCDYYRYVTDWIAPDE